jgi:hypothetical protein
MHRTALTRLLRSSCLALAFLGCVSAAPACTIPVFRYALERWELSPYDVIVFHRGSLPADIRTRLDALPRQGNFVVRLADVDDLEPDLAVLWKAQQPQASLPWVVVRRPDAESKPAPIWSAPLDLDRLRQLADSPARQQIVDALQTGASGVFVLLDSGEQAADTAAGSLVQSQLGRLEQLVKLPEQRGDGPRIRYALPLKVSLPVLRIRRDDPAEAAFVRVLLGSEPGLSAVRGPILLPVFGRGRLLGSLYGKDLSSENLINVVSFLCGECSCEVKELNPGMDLPITADWPAIFAKIGPAPEGGPETPPGATRITARAKPAAGATLVAPGVAKLGGPQAVQERETLSLYPSDTAPVAVADAPSPTPPEASGTPAARSPYRQWLWLATLAAGVLVVVTGGWACCQVRRRGR